MFFSDIVGFANQTEGMESEDFTFILNGYLNRMAEVVLKHGGTLDKFIGDAVLVFFGDPETKGVAEDAVACVRMALEMKEAIVELNREWLAKGIRQGFEVRMGISTGFSTVGNFGSDERMDYTIIGKQVNSPTGCKLRRSQGKSSSVRRRGCWSETCSVVSPRNPVQAQRLRTPDPDLCCDGSPRSPRAGAHRRCPARLPVDA